MQGSHLMVLVLQSTLNHFTLGDKTAVMQNNYKTCITPFWYISLLLLHEYYMYMKLRYATLLGDLNTP